MCCVVRCWAPVFACVDTGGVDVLGAVFVDEPCADVVRVVWGAVLVRVVVAVVVGLVVEVDVLVDV